MRQFELPDDDGLGNDDTEVLLRTPIADPPVVVVRASFGPGPLNLWVATPGGVATIGRASDSELVLRHPSVSRYHARVEVDADGALVLVDLGSTNGTFLNQTPIRGRIPIEPGDKIHIGGVPVSIEQMSTTELENLRAAANRLNTARRDTLTGLVTRRWLEDNLGPWLERQRQRGEHACCLYIDLDGFKGVNDRSGHAAGDTVLRQVSVLIQGAIRDRDVAVRVGGDEVVVFLAKCRLAEAMVVAERLCAGVGAYDFGEGIPRGQITLSIGVAEHRGEDARDWMARADRAMYAAKGSRNRAVAAD